MFFTRGDVDSCGPPISVLTAHDEPRSNRVRQQSGAGRELARRVAGGDRHGDAGQGLKWNPTAIANLGRAGTSLEVDGIGSATARGGGGRTDNLAMEFGQSPPRLGERKGNREVQGTHLEDPEPTRSPEGSQRRRRAAAGQNHRSKADGATAALTAN